MSGSLPAPPAFHHGAGAGRNGDGAEGMWDIDRSEFSQWGANDLEVSDLPLPPAHIRGPHKHPAAGDRGSRRWGPLNEDYMPLPSLGNPPTDFPPPPPRKLVDALNKSARGLAPARASIGHSSATQKTTRIAAAAAHLGNGSKEAHRETRNVTTTATPHQTWGTERAAEPEDDFQGLLLRYKKYVDDRIMPQLNATQRSLSSSEEKVAVLTAELQEVREERTALKGSVQQLRSLLDQERVVGSEEHAEHVALLSQRWNAERSALEAKLAVAERSSQKDITTIQRVGELERTLELRDFELRSLKKQFNLQQIPQPTNAANRGAGGGGDGLNAAEGMGRAVAEVELLVAEAVSFGRAFQESSAAAGIQQLDYSPSTAWDDVISASGQDANAAGGDVFGDVVAAIRRASKAERAAFSTAMGHLAAIHGELLTSVGSREHELWRVKDMHQQRLEELERDFKEQLQALNAQLQFPGSAMQSSSPARGVQYQPAAPSPLHRADVASPCPPSPDRQPKKPPTTTNTSSQTNLELSLLFPARAAHLPTDETHRSAPATSNADVFDGEHFGNVGGGGGLSFAGPPSGHQGQAFQRLAAELAVLQEENTRLKHEVRRYEQERRKYLGFMRLGSEGAPSASNYHQWNVNDVDGRRQPGVDIGNSQFQRATLLSGSATSMLLS